MLYAFREREEILKIFERFAGQRMMTSYIRIGGLALEPPAGWRELVKTIPGLLWPLRAPVAGAPPALVAVAARVHPVAAAGGSSCHGGFLGHRNHFHKSQLPRLLGFLVSLDVTAHRARAAGVAPATAARVRFGGIVSYYDGAVIVMPSTGTAKVEPEDMISASLIVELPARAKFYVDGKLIPGESASRKFHTPQLAKGKTYYYEFKRNWPWTANLRSRNRERCS